MNLSVRSRKQLADLLGVSVRQIGRLRQANLIPREPNGDYNLCTVISTVLGHYRNRLTLAERLCRDYLPGELQARYRAEGLSLDE